VGFLALLNRREYAKIAHPPTGDKAWMPAPVLNHYGEISKPYYQRTHSSLIQLFIYPMEQDAQQGNSGDFDVELADVDWSIFDAKLAFSK